MTSRQYEYILMIAQEGNLSKAAKRIGVSLSYLSKQIQMIETELGVQILTRNASHAHLNYIGQELEQRARLLLLQERSMKQEMIDSMDQRTGMSVLDPIAVRICCLKYCLNFTVNIKRHRSIS